MNLAVVDAIQASGPPRTRRDDYGSLAIAPPIPELSFALTAKGGRFDGESETFISVPPRSADIIGPLATRSTPNGHGAAGVNSQEAAAGQLVPVAFAQNTRDEVRELGGNIVGALPAQPGMKQQTYLAFQNSQSGVREVDTHATLDSNNGSRRHNGVAGAFGVRRLMPIECERCQGMPDDWTRYGVNDKGETVELSDSARYRLIGNSVAIPCLEWIGRRLESRGRSPD